MKKKRRNVMLPVQPLKRNRGPTSWKDVELHHLEKIRGVCFDIDDTVSTQGKLTSEAFSALWELKHAGFALVPITGRSAGWCDHIVRFWPVDAVVGENGAFTFFMEKGVRKKLKTLKNVQDTDLNHNLLQLKESIRSRFPNAQWASDQGYREYDLAIDICEDVSSWPSEEIDELLSLCVKEGAHAKLSSIHVNVWFGDYDKRKGFENWLENKAPGCQSGVLSKDQWIFIGDSPNDEPMFASFQLSVGVANLKKYLPSLKACPTWIAQSESGKGFAEMAQKLISSSRGNPGFSSQRGTTGEKRRG